MHNEELHILLARGMGLISDDEYLQLREDPCQDTLTALKAKLSEGELEGLDRAFRIAIGENKVASHRKPDQRDSSHITNTRSDEKTPQQPPAQKAKLVSVPPAANQAFDITPEVEDRYYIKKEQGRGGIGRVLLAFDQHIGRNVAIKELLQSAEWDGSSPNELEETAFEEKQIRFLKEARITGQLQHPSIVPVYEIGRREDGTYYYTMKLVEGRTLSQAIEDCKSIEDGLKLLPHFRDMCQAIAFAHSSGVIHRDIKPSNVMIGKFGQTVVLDWGIAKLLAESEGAGSMDGQQLIEELGGSKTVEGSTLGTPAYMSPEQTRGEQDEIDELSDVYSLGACLYEILSGRPPHTGAHVWEIILKVLCEPVRPLEAESSPPPRELAAIAYKALSKEKEDRYQSASELAGAVEAYMSGEKISGYQYTSRELFWRFVTRHKMWFFATCLSLLIVVGALVSISVALSNARQANEKMSEAVSQEMIALENERLARRDTNYHMAGGLNREADLLAEEKKFLSARVFAASSLVNNPATLNGPNASPDFAANNPKSVQIRAEAATKIYHAQLESFVSLQSVISTGDALFGVAISKNGRLAAAGGKSGEVYLIDVASEKITRRLTGHSKIVKYLSFSPDGKQLASASFDKTVKIWNTSTGELLHTLGGHDGSLFSLGFSPCGRWIASAGDDSKIVVWDVRAGEQAYTLDGHTGRILSVAFSPDGKELVSSGHDKKTIAWDLNSRRARFAVDWDLGSIHIATFTSDGQRIIIGTRSGKIAVLDARDGHKIAILVGHKRNVEDLAIGRSGKLLASASADLTICFWDLENLTLLLKVDAHDAMVTSVSFSDNEKTLVSVGTGSEIKTWKLDHRSALPVLAGHENAIWDLAFSPDGRQVASAGNDSTARIWDAATGRELHNLQGHVSTIKAIAYSPDGRLLFTASRDKTIKFWNPAQGELIRSISAHDGPASHLVVTPDSNRLVSVGDDNLIKVWDVNTGSLTSSFKAHDDWVFRLAMSPDGKKVATASFDKTARIWDLDSGKQLKSFKGTDWVSGVAFSNDGKVLLTSGKDAKAAMWDISTGEKIKEFIGHDLWVNNVAMNLEGTLVATSSDDATVRIWSVETAEPVLVWKTRESIGIAFSPDGRKLALGDRELARILPMEFDTLVGKPELQLSQAKKVAGLELEGFQAIPKELMASVFDTP